MVAAAQPADAPPRGCRWRRSSDTVYALGGATSAGHLGSTKEAEALDLSGKPASVRPTPI